MTIALTIAAVGILFLVLRTFVKIALYLLALGVVLALLYYLYQWMLQNGMWTNITDLVNQFWDWFRQFFPDNLNI